jgi:hypothetical protein
MYGMVCTAPGDICMTWYVQHQVLYVWHGVYSTRCCMYGMVCTAPGAICMAWYAQHQVLYVWHGVYSTRCYIDVW